MTRSFSMLAAFGLTALGALSGCAGGEVGEVKLGVDVAAIKISTGTTVVDDTAGAGADAALTIDRVRLLVAHAKIGYTNHGCNDSSDSSDSADVGPFVVDLTAEEIKNGAHREFSLGKLPTGTYGGAEIEIEPLDADADTSDPAVADFVKAGASVLIDGTYKGAAYTFAGHFLAEQGTDGDVEVDVAKPVALAMTVDTSSWFMDSAGTSIDPSDTAQHDALAVAVCKTLDTQPQTSGGAPTAGPLGRGGKGGGKGGGGDAHCVEKAQ